MKSLADLIENVTTAIKDPEILQKWIQYQWALRTWSEPSLCVGPGIFRGFPHFNAYLGAWKYRPNESEILFLKRSLSVATTVLDVGANFGVLTALMCELAPNARVYAFEPNPQTFAALQQNVVANGLAGRVRCVQSAVGASVGTVSFLDTGAPATNRIAGDDAGGFQVALTTVDTFLREHGLSSIDFLKIDVEGAELEVLCGAQAAFEKKLIRGGMIEICPGNLKLYGKSVVDLRAFFAAHGYDLWWYGSDGELVGVVSADVPHDFLGNAVFMSKQSDRPADAQSSDDAHPGS